MGKRKKLQRIQAEDIVAPAPRSLPAPSFGLRHSSNFFPVVDSEEHPTRSPALANQIIDLVNNCPEVASALEIICAYVLSSGVGDELGFAILPDKQDPKPRTVALARSVVSRSGDIWLWWQIIWRMMAWGDAFGLVDLNLDQMQIDRLSLLPSWQCFAIPDPLCNIQHYEQRFGVSKAIIPTNRMIHWSYNRRYLYGRSLWTEALDDWAKLKEVDIDLAEASRSASIQPNLHIMPIGTDDAYKRTYKTDHEERKKQGIIADIYLQHGADVKKPQNFPTAAPLNSFIDHHNLRRLRIAARSRVPLYLLGIDSKFGKEIAYQPALSFVVFIGVVRQLLAAGLRQLINTELALKQVPPSSWKYRIVFPRINVNPWQQTIEEDVNAEGVEDMDAAINLEIF